MVLCAEYRAQKTCAAALFSFRVSVGGGRGGIALPIPESDFEKGLEFSLFLSSGHSRMELKWSGAGIYTLPQKAFN